MLHLLPCRQRIDPGAQCRAAQPTPITPSRRRKTQLIMLVLKEAVNDKYDYISWWLYEGEPDYKVWSSDNTEEWNLTEPEALYDFIVNECQE